MMRLSQSGRATPLRVEARDGKVIQQMDGLQMRLRLRLGYAEAFKSMDVHSHGSLTTLSLQFILPDDDQYYVN